MKFYYLLNFIYLFYFYLLKPFIPILIFVFMGLKVRVRFTRQIHLINYNKLYNYQGPESRW